MRMGINPLDPGAAAGRPDRDVGRGHGTRALGPSDSSDSGSDIVGAPGLGQLSDDEETLAGRTAGPDVGDANLDSDSDRSGTGERAAAARDSAADGADIDADHIEALPEGFEDDEDAGD
jgi:hypothetical protein